MEDKKINEKESLEIITLMIESTKQRLNLGDGNLLLVWGYTCVIVTALVTIALLITRHHASNWLWFLIWIVGGTVTARMEQNKAKRQTVRTYVDRITNGLWSIVGFSAIAATFICLALMLFWAKDCWSLLLFFGLFVVGMAVAIQGVIIKEKSLIFGGTIGILSGLIIGACIISRTPLCLEWSMPLIAVSFTAMFIVPGHIINHKAKHLCSKS